MKALLAGSFDPPTLGHIDLITRAAKLFKTLYIVIAQNPNKKPFLAPEVRLNYLKKTFPECEVHIVEGLIADFAKKHQVDCLVRGLRPQNLAHECELFFGNKLLANIETLFLPTDPKYGFISSTLVREIAQNGGDLKNLVPEDLISFIS